MLTSTSDVPYIHFSGIGFNASNIVVTETTDADFDYFEGLSSSYESCYPGGKNLCTSFKVTGNKTRLEIYYDKIHRLGKYTLSFNTNTAYKGNSLYAKDSAFLSRLVTNTNGKVTVTFDVTEANIDKINSLGYIWVYRSERDIDEPTNLQLEEGTTATSYEPSIDKYRVEYKVTGKNLCDQQWENKNMELDGTISNTSTVRLSANYLKIQPNTSYVIRSEKGDFLGGQMTTRYFDSNFNYLGAGTVAQSSYHTVSVSPQNASYVKIRVSVGQVAMQNLQFEEGIQATSYEPYTEHVKTFYLNSPLLEGDKLVTKNGKVYHYHKMGQVTINPNSIIDEDTGVSGKVRWLLWCHDNIKDVPQREIHSFCNNYPVVTGVSTWGTEGFKEGVSQNATQHKLYLYLEKYSTRSTSTKNLLIQELTQNPLEIVYELANPYYELIDENDNTIINILKNVAHLTHTTAVPVKSTTFNKYIDELNVLEANTQYRVMFDTDKANISTTVTLGGTSVNITTVNGKNSLLITTPSTLVDKNLSIDGIRRCTIDNIRIFKGDVEYDYVKGLWSGYEERRLENLTDITETGVISNGNTIANWYAIPIKNFPNHKVYTVICDKTNKTGLTIYNSEGGGILSLIGINNESHVICKFKKYSNAYAYIGIVTNDKNKNVYHGIYNILILEGDWTDNPPTYEEVIANEGKYAVKVKLDNSNATIFGKGGRL